MDNQVPDSLLSFLKEELMTAYHIIEDVNYSKIICSNLTFDILYYIHQVPLLDEPSKKIIHINAQQFRRDSDKILHRLKVVAGKATRIYARQTVRARVDKKFATEFQIENHLQIPLPGKYRYGLFYQGELVSLAVFSGGRTMKNKGENHRSFELLRFCHKSSLLVVGGLSKLIKAFIADFKPNDIMTYVDMDWSQDSSLKTIGFKIEGQNPPQNFWIDQHKQYTVLQPLDLEKIKLEHPTGYLIQNQGSIKLVLYVDYTI